MATRLPYPSRTAVTAQREINRRGRLLRDPEYLAGQRALKAALGTRQDNESELIATIRRIVNPYREEKKC